MPVDNSTIAVTTTVTGTGWSVNVTACKLDSTTSVKDFQVVSGTTIIDNSLFNKTSATSLTYVGPALPAFTPIQITRRTPVTRVSELTGYGAKLNTISYEGELNRLHRIVHETQARLVSLEAGGGIGGSPVSDGVYPTGWDGEVNIAPSQNAVFDVLQLTRPAGELSPFVVSTLPFGWLECNGQAVSRTTFSRLFALIGTTFGVGNGTTTFNVPNLDGQTIAQRTGSRTFNTSHGTLTVPVPLLQHNHSISAPVSGTGRTLYEAGAGGTLNNPFGAGVNFRLETAPNTTVNAGTVGATLDPTQPTRYLVWAISTGLQ